MKAAIVEINEREPPAAFGRRVAGRPEKHMLCAAIVVIEPAAMNLPEPFGELAQEFAALVRRTKIFDLRSQRAGVGDLFGDEIIGAQPRTLPQFRANDRSGGRQAHRRQPVAGVPLVARFGGHKQTAEPLAQIAREHPLGIDTPRRLTRRRELQPNDAARAAGFRQPMIRIRTGPDLIPRNRRQIERLVTANANAAKPATAIGGKLFVAICPKVAAFLEKMHGQLVPRTRLNGCDDEPRMGNCQPA